MISYSIQAFLGVFIAILVVFTFQGEPEEPPSKMAIVDRDDDIVGTIWLLLTEKAFLKVSFVFAFYLTVLITSQENLLLIAKEFGYSNSEAFLFLMAYIFGGIIGIFSAGIVLHKFRWYK